jgi:hypothetical protein
VQVLLLPDDILRSFLLRATDEKNQLLTKVLIHKKLQLKDGAT